MPNNLYSFKRIMLFFFLALLSMYSCLPKESQDTDLKYKDKSVHTLKSNYTNYYALYLKEKVLQNAYLLGNLYYTESGYAPFPNCEQIDDIYKYIFAYDLFKDSFDTTFVTNSINDCIASEKLRNTSNHLDALVMLKILYSANNNTYAARQIADELIANRSANFSIAVFIYLKKLYAIDSLMSLVPLENEQQTAFKDFADLLESHSCIEDNAEIPISIPNMEILNLNISQETENILNHALISFCSDNLSQEDRFDDYILLTATTENLGSLFT